MTKLAKALQAAAGNAGAGSLYVEDVFSTYLYTGNSSTQTLTNGIDLAGEGGMVWTKSRSGAIRPVVSDTVRGVNKNLYTYDTSTEVTSTTSITAFNSDGYSFSSNTFINGNGNTYASWTFRKAPKFFDVVTYTGDGNSSQAIAHNLESVPGCIIIKCIDNVRNWIVYHRANTAAPQTDFLKLNLTDATQDLNTIWNDQAPTDTAFVVGSNTSVNESGYTYVAYLFAHDAGGFGDAGDQNVISCGSFTTDASGNASINIGYEPQWVLFKCSSAVEDWRLMDIMRGMSVKDASLSTNRVLRANTADAESATEGCYPTATGFEIVARAPSQTYIYIAIRRGPMKTPTSATSVFVPVTATVSSTDYSVTTNFPVDLLISESRTGAISRNLNDRLRGGNSLGMVYLDTTSATAAEGTVSGYGYGFDYSNKIVDNFNYWNAGTDNFVYWAFRRAAGFFDIVCYIGNGVSGSSFSHNLGVKPEFMIVKRRNNTGNFRVYVEPLTYTDYLSLGTTDAATTATLWVAEPTSSVFYVSSGTSVNASGSSYVAYLFASIPGVSKVGSYTGTGTTLQINCGFSTGARFVLIKRTDSTGDWYVWDSARGIVAGNDPYLLLNSSAAEVTSTDYVDTYSAGFEISSTAPAAINASGGTFIYLAIA